MKPRELEDVERLKRKREQMISIAKTMLIRMRRTRFDARHGAAEVWFTITVATMIVIAVARAKAIERAIAKKMAASTTTRPATWRTDWEEEEYSVRRVPAVA